MPIKPLPIKELFSGASTYIVPMYQRNYAWKQAEIDQLIRDVFDYQEEKADSIYYIGTLVVFLREDGCLEVIDGQQRLTTLMLLSLWLRNYQRKNNVSIYPMDWMQVINLGFESRTISTTTLEKLGQGVSVHLLDSKEKNQGIVDGYKLISDAIHRIVGDKTEDFFEYLFNQVQITQILVPEDTDLNHYFEVMNSRGEQLEKHEIIKARLMGVLTEAGCNTAAFSSVWDACANIEHYIQYGFNTEHRKNLFLEKADESLNLKINSYAELDNIISSSTVAVTNAIALADIIKDSPREQKSPSKNNEESGRFNTITNFPNFLLHVLRVWSKKNVALDDKQLIKQFEEHLYGVESPEPKVENIKSFIFALLKCKFLLDHYILKREMVGGKEEWSLKQLYLPPSATSLSYKNTFSDESQNKRILLLLSAFHVSTPTQAYKHWLNGALNYLYEAYGLSQKICSKEYLVNLERLAKKFIFKRYLAQGDGQDYFSLIYESKAQEFVIDEQSIDLKKLSYQQIQNNFVFNYLDYLLWVNGPKPGEDKKVYDRFEFTFRSSVEHFYPQHPINGAPMAELQEQDKDHIQYLHNFGNLCLISHSKNSKLSNYLPSAKKEHFSDDLKQGKIDSLKLYKMLKTLERSMLKQVDSPHSDYSWGKHETQENLEEMLTVLFERNS